MDYKKLTIYTSDIALQEVLIALLSEDNFESFEQTDQAIIAYIPNNLWNKAVAEKHTQHFKLNFDLETIPKQNWNALWEQNYEPVIVPDFCTITADFHTIDIDTPYHILLQPKMSFGTGHHATTQLMIQLMRNLNFHQKAILDFGTGTGVLAILAAQMQAETIIAIDVEEWSIENTIENAQKNNCTKIKAIVGSLETVDKLHFNVILANINRHILLQYMAQLKTQLLPEAQLLISGILEDDLPIIKASIAENNLQINEILTLNNWVALSLSLL